MIWPNDAAAKLRALGGDGADMAFLELVDYRGVKEAAPTPEVKAPVAKKKAKS